MLEHLLLLATVIQGLGLARVLRRTDGGQRGHGVVLLIGLTLCTYALLRKESFVAVVALSACTLTSVLPWLLEAMARQAFAAGRLAWAVRLAGARAMLMPGAGLARQQEILNGLAVLEQDGVDAAIAHFRRLANETEDGGELMAIHEQIVSMLFYGQRWSEGIAHYEGQFRPGYAAMRPALALGLLRAYGEAGRMAPAAGLLRALEEGPMSADPRATEVLCQARVTFLAYAGAAGAVTEAVTDERCRSLGLSPANAALLRGIAWSRAGVVDRARDELHRVESLAGPQDGRVVEASRRALEQPEPSALELEPELRTYVVGVASRLSALLRAAPLRLSRRGTLVGVIGLIATTVLVYLTMLALDRGGMALLTVGGLTPGLWAAGSWARICTATFVHADAVGLVLDTYAIVLGGALVERAFGAARVLAVALVGGAVGLGTALFLELHPATVLAGGAGLAAALLGGALACLFSRAGGQLRPRVRRGLAITYALVIAALVFVHLPLGGAIVMPPAGLLAAAATGALLALVPQARPGHGSTVVERIVAGALVALSTAAAVKVAGEDVESYFVAARERGWSSGGVALRVPETFAEVSEAERFASLPLPLLPGLVDELELRARVQVQFVVVAGARDPSGEGTRLFELDPGLARELTSRPVGTVPAAFTERLEGREVRVHTLRRDGVAVATVVEHDVIGADGVGTLLVVAAPGSALDHAPALYGAIVADSVRDAAAR